MIRISRRIAALQVRRPGGFLLVFAVLAALGAWRASKLRLVADFADLLPENQPSVLELHRILGRTRGLSNVFVVLEGGDPATLRRAADALVPRLRAIGPPYVAIARSGVQDARRFLMPRAGVYMSPADLDEIEGSIKDQERAAFRHGIGADLDDDDGPPAAPAAQQIEARLSDKLHGADRFPDGYYLKKTANGWAQVVALKAGVSTGDLRMAHATVDRVQAVVNAVLSEMRLGAQVHAGYAGDLVTGMAEYELVRRDVLDVGAVGIVLVLLVIVFYFRSVWSLLALGVTIATGCALTFGLTELALGHLNVVTAFLFSIVAGNGINFGIIWLGRYRQERQAGEPQSIAVERALARTYSATLTAAGAAATAYAALGIGHFRGFQHFAFIGGTGMIVCWLVTYALLPAVVVLIERWRSAVTEAPPLPFERPFVWLVGRAPGATLIATLVLGGIAAVAGGRYLARGALEYDMHHLRSDPTTTGELYRVSNVTSDVLGSNGSSMGLIVLTDDRRDTPVLAGLLRNKRDLAPHALRPFEEVHTLDDLVPDDQAQRLERARALGRRLQRLHDRGAIDDPTWARLSPLLPSPQLGPFTDGDLPFQLREPFAEADGTEGRILYLEATAGQSDSNLHYLMRLADAFRSTRLPDGREVRGSGPAVIFADLLRASLVDMPRSVLLSLLLTAIAVALFFRRAGPIALVLGTLALALTWMVGAMAASNVRLSFINFIALPITFGIGIDYPVNIYGRYAQERGRGVLEALRGAGGPVILCSLTTSLGYLALLRSHNQAVRGLGGVAVLGEVTCLCAALLFLPAAITWWRRRQARADSGPHAGG